MPATACPENRPGLPGRPCRYTGGQGTAGQSPLAKRELFDMTFVRRVLKEHVSGKRDWSFQLWPQTLNPKR